MLPNIYIFTVIHKRFMSKKTTAHTKMWLWEVLIFGYVWMVFSLFCHHLCSRFLVAKWRRKRKYGWKCETWRQWKREIESKRRKEEGKRRKMIYATWLLLSHWFHVTYKRSINNKERKEVEKVIMCHSIENFGNIVLHLVKVKVDKIVQTYKLFFLLLLLSLFGECCVLKHKEKANSFRKLAAWQIHIHH